MLRRVVPLALAALTATACAGLPVPRSQLEGWYEVETSGVRILADGGPERLREVAADLTAFDAAFAYLFGRRIEPTVRTKICLIGNPRLADRFHLGRGVEGLALVTLEGAFALVRLRPNSAQTRITLFHEYTHLLLARNRRTPLPRWYNEGLSEYFSTLGRRDGAVVVGAVPGNRLEWLAARGPMPLDRLFDSIEERQPQEMLDFYATSWALSHYLMATPTGRRALARFSDDLAHGAAVEEARRAAFERTWESLTEELSAHIDHLVRGFDAEAALESDRIAIDEPPAPHPLTAGDAALELGVLALALADEGESEHNLHVARALLEAALADDDEDGRARAALARARALEGELAVAEETISIALRNTPDDTEVLLRAGQVALSAEEPGLAEARFRSALSLDESSAAAWFGLGRSLARTDRSKAALAALERARALAWSASLDVEIARLLLEAARQDEAFALLWPLTQDPHGGRASEEARDLLSEAGLMPEAP